MVRYLVKYSDGGEKVFQSKESAEAELGHAPPHPDSNMSVTPYASLEWLPARVAVLESRRGTLLDYLDMVTEREDWHGVMDAAADLRETDTELETLRRIVSSG